MRMIRTVALAGAATLCLTGAAVAAEAHKAKAEPVAKPVPVVAFVPVRYIPVPVVRVRQVDPFLRMHRIMAAMQQRQALLMRQAALMAAQARAEGPTIAVDQAAAGAMPAGGYSITYVSTSTGNGTCGQVTQVTARQGAAPQRISRTFGDCGESATPAPQPAAPARAAPRPVVPTI